MRMFILDAEKAFANNLRDRINARCPRAGAISAYNLDEIAVKLNQIKQFPVLCLYNCMDFPDLPDWLGEKELLNKWTLWPIIPGSSAVQATSGKCFHRFAIKSILSAVEKWVLQMKSTADIYPDSPKDYSRATTEFCLYFSFEHNYSPQLILEIIRAKIKAGRRTIYLPLMPTYSMQLVSCPDSGPGMSDLLLNLLGKNIQAEHLSRYWQPHPRGYYQFRPPDRSDDLVNCDPEILRHLVLLLQQYFQDSSENSSVIIDCRSIPLTSVRTVAVLCDHCDFTAPAGEGYALKAGQREISLLLSELPSSCHINLSSSINEKDTTDIQGKENAP